MNPIQILFLIAALQFKHFLCDGPLQTKAMVEAKSHYGRGQGVLHSFLHAAGNLGVLLLFGQSIVLSLALAAVDLVVHYHVDFFKENTVKLFRWSPQDSYFWWAMSADQMLHQFTYLVVVGVLITAA